MQNDDWENVFEWDFFIIEKHISKWYERAVRPPWVRLILKNHENKILLTKEFRHEQWGFDYRLPWGKVFDELEWYLQVRDNQPMLLEYAFEAARREAKEEAGVQQISDLQLFDTSLDGASVEWTLFYFTGNISWLWEQELDGDEGIHGIEVWFFTPEEIKEMIQRKEIMEDRSVGVLCQYLV